MRLAFSASSSSRRLSSRALSALRSKLVCDVDGVSQAGREIDGRRAGIGMGLVRSPIMAPTDGDRVGRIPRSSTIIG